MNCPHCETELLWWRVFLFDRHMSLKCKECGTRFYLDLNDASQKGLKWGLVIVLSASLLSMPVVLSLHRYAWGLAVCGGLFALLLMVCGYTVLKAKTAMENPPTNPREVRFTRLGMLLFAMYFVGMAICKSIFQRGSGQCLTCIEREMMSFPN